MTSLCVALKLFFFEDGGGKIQGCGPAGESNDNHGPYPLKNTDVTISRSLLVPWSCLSES